MPVMPMAGFERAEAKVICVRPQHVYGVTE